MKNLSPVQVEELKRASLPLQEWLRANTHPMCSVLVDSNSVQLDESQCYIISGEPEALLLPFVDHRTGIQCYGTSGIGGSVTPVAHSNEGPKI